MDVTSNPSNTGFAVYYSGGTQLSAKVTLNTSGKISPTDAEATNYKAVVGSLKLGIMAGQLGVNNACFGGNELVAAVTPSTATGPVTIKRAVTSLGCYIGSTPDPNCPPPGDDTGDFYTTDPQQITPGGSANGHVYNVDTPGEIFRSANPTVERIRYNFNAMAIGPDGSTSISPNLSYYVRLSCVTNASGVAELNNDVTGDNQIGLGTAKTTWNLQ